MPASVHTKTISTPANTEAQWEQICAAEQLMLRADAHAKCISKGFTADHLLSSATAWMLVSSWSSLEETLGCIFQLSFVQKEPC